ncbi:Bifunctional adenosylcobalamin biosynthesis protein CobP [uncultured delta proteobacterium]|uniref:Adenosylcobinamide kinase n=1 Tax=uncultured delta proteobacterium TaxID=34034 RepID=A0A212JEX3_9DELT|nr:Bifunctional adenosylcobalamin biosynthesis protein CobP [uncultured delta proteobacterium]
MLVCTGGCRSGKSEFARQWAESRAALRVYMATAYDGGDEEMHRRIARHQASRGEGWATYEVASGPWETPERLAASASAMGDVLLFDCLTLWTSLCLEKGYDEAGTLALTTRLLTSLRECGKPVVLVTNEVGMGLVPENALGRQFRDMAGLVNQRAALVADTMVFMVSGLPLYVKGNPDN